MLTDLQTRKITRAFQLADMDHDGALEKSDYEQYAAQMAHSFDVAADSSAYQILLQKIMSDWEMSRTMLSKDDDKITLQEFLAFHDGVINSPMLDAFVAGYVDSTLAMWRVVDPHGPANAANPFRFARFLKTFGVSQADADEAFRRLDKNGNGVMERDEMIAAQKEFFASDDPNAAGNWLLGAY